MAKVFTKEEIKFIKALLKFNGCAKYDKVDCFNIHSGVETFIVESNTYPIGKRYYKRLVIKYQYQKKLVVEFSSNELFKNTNEWDTYRLDDLENAVDE